jgi:hypothetical protein
VTQASTRPSATTLQWAVRLLAVQAVAVAVATGWAGWAAATTSSISASSAAGTTVFAALMAVILGGLAFALGRLRPWARGPAIVIEMLMIPMGYYMATGGVAWIGVLMMVIGLVGAGLLLAPSTRTALGLDR